MWALVIKTLSFVTPISIAGYWHEWIIWFLICYYDSTLSEGSRTNRKRCAFTIDNFTTKHKLTYLLLKGEITSCVLILNMLFRAWNYKRIFITKSWASLDSRTGWSYFLLELFTWKRNAAYFKTDYLNWIRNVVIKIKHLVNDSGLCLNGHSGNNWS